MLTCKSMPKRKPRPDNEFLKKPKRRGSFLGGLFRFLWAVRYLILLAIIGVLGFLNRTALVDSFGWGLVFFAAAFITLFVQLKRRKLSSFILRGNRWLGSAALILAIWGILGFYQLGGKFGQDIISYPAPDIVGILRISGLVVVGILLAAPKACFRAVVKFIFWLREQFKPPPVPKYLEKQLREEQAQPPIHAHQTR